MSHPTDPPRREPLWRRYRRFFGADVRADVDDELAFHVEMRAAEYVAAGMRPDDARRRALARFGPPADVRAACLTIGHRRQRTMRRAESRTAFRHDVAFALRTLRRQRLPALVAVLCLALGIGATTTVFGVADALLLRPLPFPHGDRLASILTSRDGERLPGGVASYEDVADWRARSRAFTHVATIERRSVTLLRRGADPERVRAAGVGRELFPALGVTAERGRLFTPDDHLPGAPRVAVVGRGLADRLLGGADRVVGATIDLAGVPVTVVGVLPERWRFPETVELWTPHAEVTNADLRGNRYVEVVAALPADAGADGLARARREIAAISASLAREYARDNAGIAAEVEPLRERYVGKARSAFLAMAAAAGLVFLTACANVASLQLARAAGRAGEIAVRTALGAPRRRVVSQLLTESVLLALAGGALGTGLAVAGSGAVARAVAPGLPPWMSFTLDWRVLAFTFVVAAAAGILFGLAPALRLARPDTARALRAAGRSGGLDLTRGRFYRGLVAAEVALSVVLLVGAGLAVESFLRLRRVDAGFDASGVVAFRISLQGARYAGDTARAQAVDAIRARLLAIPGVVAAGATTHVPIRDCCSHFGFRIEGAAEQETRMPMATGALVTPGYFRSLGVALLRGRDFTAADDAGAPRVTVVSETFARRWWPGVDPLGRRLHLGDDWWTVVGVVRDVKQGALADAPEPQFYRPHAQDPWGDMTFAVRAATADPAALAALVPALRRAVLAVDPTLPAHGAAPMTETLVRALAGERLYGLLFAAFAVVALALATAGVYGVAAYHVSRRTHEIGVRMALGADRGQVIRAVLREGGAVAALGVAVGLGGAALAARALARVLYGVEPGAPWLYLAVATLMAVTVCLATLGPARRASRLPPTLALRGE